MLSKSSLAISQQQSLRQFSTSQLPLANVEALQKKWTGIQRFGKPIALEGKNMFLVPFKCPLDERYDEHIEEKDRLRPADIYKHY